MWTLLATRRLPSRLTAQEKWDMCARSSLEAFIRHDIAHYTDGQVLQLSLDVTGAATQLEALVSDVFSAVITYSSINWSLQEITSVEQILQQQIGEGRSLEVRFAALLWWRYFRGNSDMIAVLMSDRTQPGDSNISRWYTQQLQRKPKTGPALSFLRELTALCFEDKSAYEIFRKGPFKTLRTLEASEIEIPKVKARSGHPFTSGHLSTLGNMVDRYTEKDIRQSQWRRDLWSCFRQRVWEPYQSIVLPDSANDIGSTTSRDVTLQILATYALWLEEYVIDTDDRIYLATAAPTTRPNTEELLAGGVRQQMYMEQFEGSSIVYISRVEILQAQEDELNQILYNIEGIWQQGVVSMDPTMYIPPEPSFGKGKDASQGPVYRPRGS
jgi:hypothetical protein